MEVTDILRIERGPSTPEKVASRIRELVSRGDLTPGDCLPPQTSLAESMGVSRSSVREALTSLEAGGFIQKLPNGRYRVTALERGRLLQPLSVVLRSDPLLILDLMEVAAVMVTDAARLAALRATPEHLERMRGYLEQLEKGSRNRRYFVREFNRTYMNFYEAMAGATGNAVYMHLGHAFMELLAQALPHTDKLFLVQEDISAVLYRQHREIWEAISRRDPDSAMRAFTRHLSFIDEKLRLILGEGLENGAARGRYGGDAEAAGPGTASSGRVKAARGLAGDGPGTGKENGDAR